jgi:hypothetical protein
VWGSKNGKFDFILVVPLAVAAYKKRQPVLIIGCTIVD